MGRIVKIETQIRKEMQKLVDTYGVDKRIDEKCFIIQPRTSLVKSWIELTKEEVTWGAIIKEGRVMTPKRARTITF